MAYWVYAYCTTDAVPTIRSLVSWLRAKGGFPKAEARFEGPAELDAPGWEEFELVYNPKKPSVQVECNRDTGPDSLCAGQVQGELDSLEDLEDSEAKCRVADCLSRTRFIICCTVVGDHGHREAHRVRAVLDYFVEHSGAILDTEDEGFYSCSDSPLLGLCAEGD
jgi:hypothetical protein